MIDKIVMFTCDFCSGVDYFPTNNIKLAKTVALDRKDPWIFKKGHEFCCKECYEKWLKEQNKF